MNRVNLIKKAKVLFNEAVAIRSAGNHWGQYRKAREMYPNGPQWVIWAIVMRSRNAIAPHWVGHMFYGYSHFLGNYPAFGRQ